MTDNHSTRHKQKSKERPAPLRGALSYTLSDAAWISGLSPATLRRRAAQKRLRLFRCGCRTLVDGDSLRRMLGVDA